MAVERRATMQFVPRRSPRRSALIRHNKAKNRRFLILRNACSYDNVDGRFNADATIGRFRASSLQR